MPTVWQSTRYSHNGTHRLHCCGQRGQERLHHSCHSHTSPPAMPITPHMEWSSRKEKRTDHSHMHHSDQQLKQQCVLTIGPTNSTNFQLYSNNTCSSELRFLSRNLQSPADYHSPIRTSSLEKTIVLVVYNGRAFKHVK